jgi:hypothetical protein
MRLVHVTASPPGRYRRRTAIGLLGATLTALVSAGGALADKEKVHLTPTGNAAARAVVVKRADLGGGSGWTGGMKKPDLSSTLGCTTYEPKQSDLVLVGTARSSWTATGLQIDSQAQVLQTSTMVRLDWQRSVLAPQVLPCLRSGLAKKLGGSRRFVSFEQIGFPKLATYSHRYRALVDVDTASGTLRVMVDIVLIGRGRTEITLTSTSLYSARSAVEAAELDLARRLAARVRV